MLVAGKRLNPPRRLRYGSYGSNRKHGYPMSLVSLKEWAGSLKTKLRALYLARQDPRVPWLAKLVIAVVVAYALSPIDLIPDFIPILGYLDDLVLVPLGIWLAVSLIPGEVWLDCEKRAAIDPFSLASSGMAAIAVVVVWVLSAAAIGVVVLRWLMRA